MTNPGDEIYFSADMDQLTYEEMEEERDRLATELYECQCLLEAMTRERDHALEQWAAALTVRMCTGSVITGGALFHAGRCPMHGEPA